MAQGDAYIRERVVPLPTEPQILASNKVTFPRDFPSIPPGYTGFLPGYRNFPGVGNTFGHFSSEEIRRRREYEQPAGLADWDWKFPFNRMRKELIIEEDPWTLPSQRRLSLERGMNKWKNYPFFLTDHYKQTIECHCFKDKPFTEYHKSYLKKENPYLKFKEDHSADALREKKQQQLKQKTMRELW